MRRGTRAGAGRGRATLIRWGVVGVLAIGLACAWGAGALPLGPAVAALRGGIADLGPWGPVVFVLIGAIAVVALVPGSALTLAAGALFGPVVGTITASIASTTGAALAFLIVRHLARARVEAAIRGDARFAAIDRAIAAEGWKVVALLRLSPAVPFNLQNYLYGLTGIGFWPCLLTTWVAMLPGTLLYVSLGHAGRAGIEAASGELPRARSPAEWALLAVGLLATVAATVVITRLARQALGRPAETDGTVDVRDPAQPPPLSGNA